MTKKFIRMKMIALAVLIKSWLLNINIEANSFKTIS
tara:strand:+ start:305 stop:412 length:108 start_codon:yes stop_codon:yes gene_type:complete